MGLWMKDEFNNVIKAAGAGKDGTNGADGADGAKGDPGLNGANGAQGAKGNTGPKGDKGDKGATGATGPKGTSQETKFVQDTTANEITTKTTAQTVLATGALSNTASGVYVVSATVDSMLEGVTASGGVPVLVVELKVKNVAQTDQIILSPRGDTGYGNPNGYVPAGFRQTVSKTWMIPATANQSVDFKLSARHAGASSAGAYDISKEHSRLSILFVQI